MTKFEWRMTNWNPITFAIRNLNFVILSGSGPNGEEGAGVLCRVPGEVVEGDSANLSETFRRVDNSGRLVGAFAAEGFGGEVG